MAIEYITFTDLTEAKQFIERMNVLKGYPDANTERYADVIVDGGNYHVKIKTQEVYDALTIAETSAVTGTNISADVTGAGSHTITETTPGETTVDVANATTRDANTIITRDGDTLLFRL